MSSAGHDGYFDDKRQQQLSHRVHEDGLEANNAPSHMKHETHDTYRHKLV